MNKYAEYPVPAITQLLEELCPQGVETVRASEVAEIGTGRSDRKDATVDGQYPFYVRSETVLRHDSWEFDETAIIIPGEGRVGEIFHYQVGKYALHQRAYRVHIIDNRLNSRFAFHCYTSMFGKFINDKAVNGTVKSLRKPMLMNFEIPLPPLEVQEQIATVLDTFTDLDTSLNRELKLRDDQFTHALDSVFGNSTAPRIALEQVGDFTKGKGITKSQLREQGIPAFHYGQVHTSYGPSTTSTISYVDSELVKNPTLAHPGDLVLATTSEDDKAVGKAVAWLGDEDAVVGGDAYVYSHSLEPRYVSYFFASHDFHLQKGSKVFGTKVRRINDKGLSALKIPVPAPEVQEQIADTLDLFSEYITNLRREIELRRQQLAYYREQLLTFPVAE